jgi:hypothetical protein
MIRKLTNMLLLQAALACLMPLTLSAQNLLHNGGFQKPATGVPPGTVVAYTDYCLGEGTAAADWASAAPLICRAQAFPRRLPAR